MRTFCGSAFLCNVFCKQKPQISLRLFVCVKELLFLVLLAFLVGSNTNLGRL